MIEIKDGSRWTDYDGKYFRVLKIVEIEKQVWIHYISENSSTPQEYSCYLESFLSRFKEVPK